MAKLKLLFEEWKSLMPLSETKQFLMSKRFSVDYNYNSNHIEGNTLTYGQTEILLLFGKVIGEGDLKDFVDMKASQLGMKAMEEQAKIKEIPLTQNFIRELHRILLREDYTVYKNLPGGFTTSYIIHAGKYKSCPNSVITRYGDRFEYASPEETPALMSDLVDWYNEAEKSGKYNPVELAALFHYRYIRIHPFEDGNGRIARLLVNYILARHGWPMIVVRSRNKSKYLEALHQADLVVGPQPSKGANASLRSAGKFITYFKSLVEEELKYDIAFAKETSEKVWWFDGQKIKFKSISGPSVLEEINSHPDITIDEISKKIGIVPRAVKRLLSSMVDKGYIQRSDRDGSWYVFATQSV